MVLVCDSAGQRRAYCDYDDESVAKVYAVLHLRANVPGWPSWGAYRGAGVRPGDPWVDPYTNITYFYNYLISILSRNILLYSTPVMEGGNMTIRSDPSWFNLVVDSYSTSNGSFDGLLVTGYGISEKRRLPYQLAGFLN